MKRLFIILFNILLFIGIYFVIDYSIFRLELHNLEKTGIDKYFSVKPKYSYKISNPEIKYDYLNNGDYSILRKPVGTEYNSEPITIFGCSVGYGQYLNDNENFGYYLSQETHRPVYNRSIAGAGLQNMYYQVSSNEFYSDVPYSSDVIYVYINDHLRRMLGLPFNILDREFYLHYSIRNNTLVKDNYNNPVLNFFRSSYLINWCKYVYFDKIQRHQHSFLQNQALMYFIKSREELEKRWGKTFNFYVFFFIKANSDRYLIDKLKQNGFKVILIQDLTSENLNSAPYLASDNSHPSEEVWKLLTPIISDIISKEDY